MSDAAAASRAGEGPRAAGLAVLLCCVGAATIAAVAVGVHPGYALVPVGLLALLYATVSAPLHWSAATMLFLVLSLEVSTDAAGTWHTPLAALGDLLQDNLERSAGIPGVSTNGLELLALYLLGVSSLRKRPGTAGNREGVVPAPRVVGAFLLLYVAGVAYAEVNGLARGGIAATWKVRQLLHVPLFTLLFQAAFRGPQDHRLLGRVVVLAASVKALLAIWVQRVAAPALTGGKLAYATNHGDSVLFALAAFILLVDLAERPGRRSALDAGLLLPLVLLGMHENDRRTAWVMLTMSLAAAWFVGPPRAWKGALNRVLLLAAPLLLVYTAVGWNRGGRLFAPIQTLRTLSDASVDRSTLWREIENWNIAMSMREHPILGIGLGAEYTEFVRGDEIATIFADFKAWPHNSVLGLLLFAGPIGFTAVWSLLGLVVFLAVRSCRRTKDPEQRAAALACIAAVIACAVLAYGDTGTHFVQYRVLLALAVAMSGKLAVASGAWPAPARPVRRAAGVP